MLLKELSQNRILANKTEKPQPKRQLHKYFFERAQSAGDKIALYSVRSGKTSSMTYAALAELALKYASALRNKGARCGGRIAVMLPRSFEQIAAVIGVLAAGCTYVPINAPAAFRQHMSGCRNRVRNHRKGKRPAQQLGCIRASAGRSRSPAGKSYTRRRNNAGIYYFHIRLLRRSQGSRHIARRRMQHNRRRKREILRDGCRRRHRNIFFRIRPVCL